MYNILMERINLYITNAQLTYLRLLSDMTVSEHIRRAINEYIEKMDSQRVTYSPSKNAKSNNKNG